MLRYQNLNTPVIIYTDTSNNIMGSIVMQDGSIVSSFLKKFDKAQINYPNKEQELLAITETFNTTATSFMMERSL